MFAIRVEHNKDGQPSHTMYRANRYTVYHEKEGHLVRLELVQGTGDPDEVQVIDGGVAYVMNNEGVTVDVIRTRATKGRK